MTSFMAIRPQVNVAPTVTQQADANNYKELLVDTGYYTEADLQ